MDRWTGDLGHVDSKYLNHNVSIAKRKIYGNYILFIILDPFDKSSINLFNFGGGNFELQTDVKQANKLNEMVVIFSSLEATTEQYGT